MTYTLSADTEMFIADVVTLEVERIDGEDVADALAGAKMIALAGVQFDLGDQFPDNRHMAETVLNAEIRSGLAARSCQCPPTEHERQHHVHAGRWVCEGHYRIDMGAVDGRLVCADCHDALTGKSAWQSK